MSRTTCCAEVAENGRNGPSRTMSPLRKTVIFSDGGSSNRALLPSRTILMRSASTTVFNSLTRRISKSKFTSMGAASAAWPRPRGLGRAAALGGASGATVDSSSSSSSPPPTQTRP